MPPPKKTDASRKAAPRKAAARKAAPARRAGPRKTPPKKKSGRRRWILPAISLLVFGYGFFRLFAHYSSEVDRELHGCYEVQYDSTRPGRAYLVGGMARSCPPAGMPQE
ncbi:MAG: hypothetical protein EOO11_05220 [Chitinophagaceae bacterium]|nr:MAG: hypothetical protein EOO11_05220 [Chitinophagaceae bacterium]